MNYCSVPCNVKLFPNSEYEIKTFLFEWVIKELSNFGVADSSQVGGSFPDFWFLDIFVIYTS